MITKFGVKNYKKFHQLSLIPFSDITILVGGNSSGKSSFIKALILLIDNLTNRLHSFFLDKERLFFDFHSVSFDNISIGTFTRALNDKTNNNTLSLHAKLEEEGHHRYIEIEVKRYDYDETLGYISRFKIHDEIHLGDIFYDFDIINGIAYISIPYGQLIESYMSGGIALRNRLAHNQEFGTEIDEQMLIYGFYQMNSGKDPGILDKDYYKSKTSIKPQEPIVNIDNDQNGTIIFEAPEATFLIEKGLAKIEVPFCMSEKNNLIDSLIAGIFTARDKKNTRLDEKDRKDILARTILIERIIKQTNTANGKMFNTKPFPHIEYIHAHGISKKVFFSIDDRNDYIARTLHEAYQTRALQHNEAHNFVKKWLRSFKIGDSIEITRVEGDGYTIKIIDVDGRSKNLVDIGTGSAQIVLLLLKVAIILSTHQTEAVLLVIEEPEQNMHPNFQSLLADLFYDMHTEGLRLLVETHSEYMIRRSQVLVAKMSSHLKYTQRKLDERNPFRVIYFPESGQPYDMHYKVNGDFEHLFGEGFFDAAAKNRVELYKMQLEQNK